MDAKFAEIPGDVERRAPRRRVLQTVIVVSTDLSISFRCIMRDRSETGARLTPPEGMIVPPQFWLIDVSAGLAFSAKTIRRKYADIGVALDSPVDLKVPGQGLQLRMRALWIEAMPRP